jgi:protein SCO1/2
MPPFAPSSASLPSATPRPPLNRTLQWVLWSVLGLMIAGIVANFVRQQWLAAERQAIVPLDHFGQVPTFTLTERSGQPFQSASLQGKIWLADFFFTACPGPCLIMNARLADIGQALQRDHADVRLVSFSIAPEADTPEVLRRYAQRFQAPGDRWSFLTGDRPTIYDLAHKAFLLPLIDNSQGQVNSADGQFIHSTRISLVDRRGEVRGSFDSAAPEVTQKVLTAVGELLREQPPAPGSPRT